MTRLLIKWFQVVVVAGGLVLAINGWSGEAEEAVDTKRPGYAAAMADMVLVRPLTFVATVAGSVVFVAALPFTLATGTIGEAGMSLVVDPALTTFARCLGCTDIGWRKLPRKDASDE